MVEFNLPVTVGAFVLVIALATASMLFTPMGDNMQTGTIFMMVVPSAVVFGLITFAIGMKFGEHRASQ